MVVLIATFYLFILFLNEILSIFEILICSFFHLLNKSINKEYVINKTIE